MSDQNKISPKNDRLSRQEITRIENSKVSKIQKENEIIAELTKKRLASLTDEEIIEENLQALLELKNREERKANGRLIAVLVAFLVIFLAIYHAWIRKTAVLAGVLVPALIMLGYGGWVVVLAKRDKQKRAIFEKHIEEVTLKNKIELEEKAKSKKNKTTKENETTRLHYENEIKSHQTGPKINSRPGSAVQIVTQVQVEDNRKKHKRRRNKELLEQEHHISLKDDGKIRKPSIRQKLFRQKGSENLFADPKLAVELEKALSAHEKRKQLQRMDTLPMPQVMRMSSAPERL